jgi:hypothetical protein
MSLKSTSGAEPGMGTIAEGTHEVVAIATPIAPLAMIA